MGIAEGSPDLSKLDFVGKKLVFLVEVAVSVLPQVQRNTDEFEKHLYQPTSTRPFGTDRAIEIILYECSSKGRSPFKDRLPSKCFLA